MSSKSLQLVKGLLMFLLSTMATIQGFAAAPPPTPITNASWISMDPNTNGAVYALALYSNDVYAGGDFTKIGGVPASGIAKWDGATWTPLGSGMDGGVKALAIDPATGNLYAGGYFTTAGGVPADCIAKWNGTAWSPLGSGMDGMFDIVNALAFNPATGDLYVGGFFTTAGGVTANNIANWNGSAWSAFGSGLDEEVNALAFHAGDIYAGGWFTNCISKWNGTAWLDLGAGVNNEVNTLAFDSSGNLYAGGWFTNADGVSANNIAKWDGFTWSDLGSGVNNEVNTIAFDSSGNLYAGGQFTTANGVSTNNIAKWNGITWSALGSGTNNSVRSLLFDSSDVLYVGGNFTIAGGKASMYLAKCSTAGVTLPGAPTAVTATPGGGQATVNFTAPVDNGNSAIILYTATSTPGAKTASGSLTSLTVTGLTNGTAYTFKVTATNALGTGPASAASNSVMPSDVPGAPKIGTAVLGNEKATVSFTAPASNGGSPILSYTVTSVTPTPGDITSTRYGSTSTPITVIGLTPGTSYSPLR